MENENRLGQIVDFMKHLQRFMISSMARPPAPRWGRALLYAVIAVLGISYTVMHTTVLDSPQSRSILQTNSPQCPTVGTHNEVLPRLGSVPEAEAKSRWEALQAQRRARVKTVCDRLNLTHNYTYDLFRHLLVDETHKVLYCFVPKVACTSWRRIWFWLTELLEDDEDIMELSRITVHGPLVPSLNHVSDELREEALTTYRKFLFTRNPFDRLVSAYRDKLENRDMESTFDFHSHVGVEIENLLRGKEAGGHNITFAEFIRWVSQPRQQQLTEWEKKEKAEAEKKDGGVDGGGGEGGGSGTNSNGGNKGNDERRQSIVEQEKQLEKIVSDDEDGNRNKREINKEGGKDVRKSEHGEGKDSENTGRDKTSSGDSGRDGAAEDDAKKTGENTEGKAGGKKGSTFGPGKVDLPEWTLAQWNEHWRPIVNLCAPCTIQYDVIGTYENLLTEVDFVLEWMGAGDFKGRFPSADRPFHASQLHRSYWNKLLPQERESFLKAYLVDHLLFGYDLLS